MAPSNAAPPAPCSERHPSCGRSLDIANVGNRAGSELIRVYVDDCVASVAQPRHLAAFRRIELDPGARTTVHFGLGSSAFTLIDTSMQERIEPGDFEITVIAGGRSQAFVAHVVERSDLRPD